MLAFKFAFTLSCFFIFLACTVHALILNDSDILYVKSLDFAESLDRLNSSNPHLTVPRGDNTSSSSLAGPLVPSRQPNINIQRLNNEGFYDLLDLTINIISIISQIWELPDYEVLRAPIAVVSRASPNIGMKFAAIPGAPILPRTDHVIWAVNGIFTRTLFDDDYGRFRGVYDWQVEKPEYAAAAFMSIETGVMKRMATQEEEEVAHHANGTVYANNTITMSSKNLKETTINNKTLQSDPLDFKIHINYLTPDLPTNDLLLFMRHFILKQFRHEPSDFMAPDLRDQKAEFMSEGYQSYQAKLITIIPDPQTAQPGENMVHFRDLVLGLQKLLQQLATERLGMCFSAVIEAFSSGRGMVPFAVLEIRPLKRGFAGVVDGKSSVVDEVA